MIYFNDEERLLMQQRKVEELREMCPLDDMDPVKREALIKRVLVQLVREGLCRLPKRPPFMLA